MQKLQILKYIILALLWLIIPNLIYLLLFTFNIRLHKPNENLTPLMHLYNCVNDRQKVIILKIQSLNEKKLTFYQGEKLLERNFFRNL